MSFADSAAVTDFDFYIKSIANVTIVEENKVNNVEDNKVNILLVQRMYHVALKEYYLPHLCSLPVSRYSF